MDTLLLAASSEHGTNGAYDLFHANVDGVIFSEQDWHKQGFVGDLQALAQEEPVLFGAVDKNDLTTQASLCITKQPGPVYVATTNARTETFIVTLAVNPLLPQSVCKTWKVSDLTVNIRQDAKDDGNIAFIQSSAGANPKKRGRAGTKKNGSRPVDLSTEYSFDHALKVVINDLVLPPSGGRPVRLEFGCTVTDAANKSVHFSASSFPFLVVSNCNQWPVGLEVCFKRLVFAREKTQVSFARFFNYLQLVYLATRCVEVERFFKPEEVYHWMVDASEHCLRMDRDRQLLAVHNVVTVEMFDMWFSQAGAVIYDLHTSNVGKLFQHLWSRGFVGIGDYALPKDGNYDDAGTCRLIINTKFHDGDGYDGQCVKLAVESYLVLKATLDASTVRSHTLLDLERDFLAYFFEHARGSSGCKYLVNCDDEKELLPLSDLYVGGSFLTKAKKQR